MRSPTLLTKCASRAGRRRGTDRDAAPFWRARAGRLLLRGRRSRTGHDGTCDAGGRAPVLCRLAQRSLLLLTYWARLDNSKFASGGFLRQGQKIFRSIALEVPNSSWAERGWAVGSCSADSNSSGRSAGGGWIQADRGARPSQTPFLAGEQNDAYLAGGASGTMRAFVPVFAHALEHTGGYSSEEATRVGLENYCWTFCATIPKTVPSSFPENAGRGLLDDVSDFFLAILTNGKVTGDNVGPHDDFLIEFPYLGPPHTIRSK